MTSYLLFLIHRGKLNENMRKQDFVRFLTELLSGKMVRARYGTSVTYRLAFKL